MTCIVSHVDLTKENSFVRSAGSECEVRWRAGLAWQGAVHFRPSVKRGFKELN